MPEQERQPTPENLRIPLQAEEATISRREIKTAEVHIALVTGTHEKPVDEELTRVRVEIERIPIGRTVETVPPVREEGDTTVIPVVEEIVVVERRLVLKEEVRIRRVSTKERHRESVVLREQKAVVTRKEVAGQPDSAPPTAPRVERYPNPKGEKS